MASNNFKSIQEGHGAIIVANDLATGRTVFLDTNYRWTTHRSDALIIVSDEQAQAQLATAKESVASNDVLDPYLVATDRDGEAAHIRELIRQQGPTVNAIPENWHSQA